MTSPGERPDPLAELPPRPRPGEPPPGPDLTYCSHLPDGQHHCTTPPSIIFWIGCLRGEHAGPLAFCAAHATTVARSGWPMHCAQCGGEVRIMKATSMDGVTTVAYDVRPAEPPSDLWKRAVPDNPQA